MLKETALEALNGFTAQERDVVKRRYVVQEAPAVTCKALDIAPAQYNDIIERALRVLRNTTDLDAIFTSEAS